jgi:hypothetical protein
MFLNIVNMIKVPHFFLWNPFKITNFTNYYKKLCHCTKSPPQIEAAAPIIRTLFFTDSTERPEEAPGMASKKRVTIEGYSG